MTVDVNADVDTDSNDDHIQYTEADIFETHVVQVDQRIVKQIANIKPLMVALIYDRKAFRKNPVLRHKDNVLICDEGHDWTYYDHNHTIKLSVGNFNAPMAVAFIYSFKPKIDKKVRLHFCPMCGTRVPRTDQEVCSNADCGIIFKDLVL